VVILSLAYMIVRQILAVLALLLRRDLSKEAELLVLRQENAVLRRSVSRSGTSQRTGCGSPPCPVCCPDPAGAKSSRSRPRPFCAGTAAWWPAAGTTATAAGQDARRHRPASAGS
jgi:hypothetical protein